MLATADLEVYWGVIGRKAGLEDWQQRQVVAALEVLLQDVVGLDWAAGYDWAAAKASFSEMEGTHPTLAREGDIECRISNIEQGMLNDERKGESRKELGADAEKTLIRLREVPGRELGNRAELVGYE